MAIEPDSEPAVVVPPQVHPIALARPSSPDRDPALPAPPPRSPPPTPPGALTVLGHGARRVISQPRLLWMVWALPMLTAMAASVPAMVTLGMLLGKRPVAMLLARGQADIFLPSCLPITRSRSPFPSAACWRRRGCSSLSSSCYRGDC